LVRKRGDGAALALRVAGLALADNAHVLLNPDQAQPNQGFRYLHTRLNARANAREIRRG
jgi:hypothetical protein